MFTLKEFCLRTVAKNSYTLLNVDLNLGKNLENYLVGEIFNYLDEYNLGIYEDCLEYFVCKRTQLKRVKFNGRRIKNKTFLAFLKNHPLESVNIKNLNEFSINDWIKYVNNEDLQELSIINCQFIDKNLLNSMNYLKKFRNLLKLNISFTKFDDNCFNFICNELLLLEYLDITNTNVQILTPIKNLTNLNTFIYRICNETIINFQQLYNLNEIDNIQYINIGFIAAKCIERIEENFLNCNYWKYLKFLRIYLHYTISKDIIRFVCLFIYLFMNVVFLIFFFRKFISYHENLEFFEIDCQGIGVYCLYILGSTDILFFDKGIVSECVLYMYEYTVYM